MKILICEVTISKVITYFLGISFKGVSLILKGAPWYGAYILLQPLAFHCLPFQLVPIKYILDMCHSIS